MPLGVLSGSLLLDAFGVRATIAGIAACYLLATVGLLFLRPLRGMDRRPPDATELVTDSLHLQPRPVSAMVDQDEPHPRGAAPR
jgi:hypothetical protein